METRATLAGFALMGALLTGCNQVETDIGKLLTVRDIARDACAGRPSKMYAGIRDTACADFFQLTECLKGDRTQCPVKGQGAF
jgi:hypothetical protein